MTHLAENFKKAFKTPLMRINEYAIFYLQETKPNYFKLSYTEKPLNIEVIEKSDKQIDRLVKYLTESDDNFKEEINYNFSMPGMHFLKHMLPHIKPNEKEIIRLYQKCYASHNLGLFLNEQTAPNKFALFSMGQIYLPDVSNQLMMLVAEFQKNIDNEYFTQDKIKQMITNHFKNSQGINFVPVVEIENAIMGLLGYHTETAEFTEAILKKYTSYKPDFLEDNTMGGMSKFKLKMSEVKSKYNLKTSHEVMELIDVIETVMKKHYNYLNIQCLSSQSLNSQGIDYIQVLIESQTQKIINAKVIEKIYIKILNDYKNIDTLFVKSIPNYLKHLDTKPEVVGVIVKYAKLDSELPINIINTVNTGDNLNINNTLRKNKI